MGIKSIINLYFLLWLAVGKASFSSNSVEEIRPGFRNIQKFLIMEHFSEMRVIRAKFQFSVWVYKYGLVKNFFYIRKGLLGLDKNSELISMDEIFPNSIGGI